jgi:teichuronic acid biosynthesis glycosyltransferase TuaG
MIDLISIITPSYNSESYLEECINSVLNQTYINWEMLIIDDG